MPHLLNVLACQIAIPVTLSSGDRDNHLASIQRKVEQALQAKQADLVVLPELASIDYSRASFEQLRQLAEPVDGPSYLVWSHLARKYGTTICYGFARQVEGSYRISIGVVGPQGDLLGCYDKIHLAQFGASMEKEFFEAGKDLLLFDVGGFTVAPIICVDIRTPELSRTLVVEHEVDLILHCGAYFRDESFYSWHPFAITRAVENQVFFLSLNRAGQNYGGSILCAPWIDEQHLPIEFDQHKEQLRHLVLDSTEIKRVRAHYSFLEDRRQSYGLSR